MKKFEAETRAVVEDIQEAIVCAGGRFFRQEEIMNMSVGDLIVLGIPNKITFTVKHEPKPKGVDKLHGYEGDMVHHFGGKDAS